MKKGLIFFVGILSFLGINTVSADTTKTITNFYSHFDEHLEAYNTYKENIDYMIDYWEENWKSSYPYYVITCNLFGLDHEPHFYLFASAYNSVTSYGSSLDFATLSTNGYVVMEYWGTTDEYKYDTQSSSVLKNINVTDNDHNLNYISILISNGAVYDSSDIDFLIPTYISDTLGITIQEMKLKKGVNMPGLVDLYNGTYVYNIEDVPNLELEDVLSNPLDTLKDVKDAIVNIFDTVVEFISLLPEPMQAFLYVSFTVAIVLGLLKIIL